MKIIFQNTVNATWLAGTTTLEMLFHALRSLPASTRPSLSLMVWSNQPPDGFRALTPLIDELVTLPGPLPPGFDVNRLLEQTQADIFFSIPTATAPFVKLPRLLWIYDFQHVHLRPDFMLKEYVRRERLFRDNAASAARIMVNSMPVLEDLRRFMPEYAAKTEIIPFVPWIPPAPPPGAIEGILKARGLPDKFIFMPNRFSRRKNHRLVLQALDILRARGIRPVVACTGEDGNANDPGNLKALIQQRDKLGLQEQFLTLGTIPRDHLFALMRWSVAVMTATLFEGFGLTVAEARFLGKPVLASDLPVLREQQTADTVYFNPQDAGDLAQKMEEIWINGRPGRDPVREQQAAAGQAAARKQFARRFMSLARTAAN